MADDFFSYLKTFRAGLTKWIKEILVFICAVALEYFVSKYLPQIGRIRKYSEAIASLVQLLVLALFLFFGFPRCRPFMNQIRYPLASASVDWFYKYWRALWCGWMAFYLIFAASLVPIMPFTFLSNRHWVILINLVHNLQAILFLMCYFELAQPTVTLVVNGPSTSAPAIIHKSFLNRCLVIVAALTLVEITVKLWLSPNASSGWSVNGFQLVSGLAAGINLALLVGRFESQYIDAPRLVLVIMYAYAIIQATYGLFFVENNPYVGLRPTATTTSLALKLILFFWISWLLKEGRMLFFLEHVRQEYPGIRSKWEDFKKENKLGGQAVGAASSN